MAVAKVAFRDREHLCALAPVDGLILMNTLHWPDEIRATEGLKTVAGEVKINPRELQMAKTLVESLSDSFEPERYHDDYREALMKVVQAKIEGEELVAAPETEGPAKVMDLMEALRASVDAAKKSRGDRKGLEIAEEAPAATEKRRRRKAS